MDYKIELEKLKEAFLYREIKKIEKDKGMINNAISFGIALIVLEGSIDQK